MTCRGRSALGWISPGTLTPAARDLAVSKKALILLKTADDAFGHLADQVHSMRERRARHPLSLSVAADRIKRDMAGKGPAIAAHDMVAAEFSQLRNQPAFNLAEYVNVTNYPALLEQVVEASRVPAGCVAALAYWGDNETRRWWTPELERFARPFVRASGLTAALELPLVTGSLLFYAAGVAAVASQRFELLDKLFDLRGHRVGRLLPVRLVEIMAPAGLVERRIPAFYQDLAAIISESLVLGTEPVDDAIQTFELLRLSTQVMHDKRFPRAVEDFYARDRAYREAAEGDDEEKTQAAVIERQRVEGRVAEWCGRFPHGAHLFASERTFDPSRGHQRWGSPIAERLADEIVRMGDSHPLVIGWRQQDDPLALWLALKGVSVAVGRCGDELQTRATPVDRAGFIPEDFWLDSGKAADVTQAAALGRS
jgi:hypothetical protein